MSDWCWLRQCALLAVAPLELGSVCVCVCGGGGGGGYGKKAIKIKHYWIVQAICDSLGNKKQNKKGKKNRKRKGLSGIRTRDLSHPKRESYP